MREMARFVMMVMCLMVVGGCTGEEGPSPTVPPIAPSHQMAGSVLPARAGGYSVLGDTPAPRDIKATYARDAQPLDFAVVSFDQTGEFGETLLEDQTWYGASRCGILWENDSATDPQSQAACITVLTDSVMVTVSGGEQTPVQLAELANAIYAVLA